MQIDHQPNTQDGPHVVKDGHHPSIKWPAGEGSWEGPGLQRRAVGGDQACRRGQLWGTRPAVEGSWEQPGLKERVVAGEGAGQQERVFGSNQTCRGGQFGGDQAYRGRQLGVIMPTGEGS